MESDTNVEDDSQYIEETNLQDETLTQQEIESAQLDNEIKSLESQIKTLSQRHQILQSHLLSTRTTQTLLSTGAASAEITPLLEAASSHSLTNLYRLCAGSTAFLVQDPDPYAVDSGRVLGIRIDICIDGAYITPYYVFLVRPRPESRDLKVHKHTLPQCIPLAALAGRYLAQPPAKTADGVQKPPLRRQDLQMFVKELRGQAVCYHKRVAAVEKLKKSLSVGKGGAEVEDGLYDVTSVTVVDAEAYMLQLKWSDGRVGRIQINAQGEVTKVVVVGDEGRYREDERILLGRPSDNRLEALGGKLQQVTNE